MGVNWEGIMKWILYVVSVILILSGGLFALQGLSLVPSRVMYGKSEWVVIGGAMVVIGAALAVFANRRVRK